MMALEMCSGFSKPHLITFITGMFQVLVTTATIAKCCSSSPFLGWHGIIFADRWQPSISTLPPKDWSKKCC